nr:RHS domain-containing protein [Pseudomonas putida]
GRSTHYVFEPGTFVPVAQAVSNHVVELIPQPVYVFPYDIDKDPVWQHKPTPKPFDALAWYQCDHLGTPMELTGEDGEIAWRGTYKAWGLAEETRSDKAKWADIRNPLRFQGQYWDVETGLHYNRYRYYEPLVGRFIGKDPIGYAGGLNVYIYAPNPTEWGDPLGLAKSRPTGGPKQAKRKVERGQAPKEITRIDAPEEDVPKSQWHAHCPCGSAYNLDGSIHDKGKGDITFSNKTIQWLNDHGWSIPKK